MRSPPSSPWIGWSARPAPRARGDPTVLILDQLQAADFRDHIRIHRLIADRAWEVRGGRYYANPRHLLFFMISEMPLYHSLQRDSFRVWIGRVSEQRIDHRPSDFGLGEEAGPLFSALGTLFRALGAAPTRGELTHILNDLQLHVRTPEHLRLSLYGRSEALGRDALADPALGDLLAATVEAAQALLVGEHIELRGD